MLDYYSEEEIKNKSKKHIATFYENKFIAIWFDSFSPENYDDLAVTYKVGDNKYKIHEIKGTLDFHNKIKKCIKKRDKIINEISSLFKNAKKDGKIFTTGVSINNLSFNENDIGDFKTFLKLSPPLRTENDRLALVESVNDGTIDVIVSDHKPQDEESKRLTFAQAATGASGVETLLPLALELFHNKSIKLRRLLASLTSNPAKILGINKGNLEVGSDADLCVLDINKPWVVKQNELKSKSKNTPIENKKLQGQVLKTFVKGEIAYERI